MLITTIAWPGFSLSSNAQALGNFEHYLELVKGPVRPKPRKPGYPTAWKPESLKARKPKLVGQSPFIMSLDRGLWFILVRNFKIPRQDLSSKANAHEG